MNPVEQYLGVVHCLPCSVAAWCDRPVYHPGPECDEELLRGSGYERATDQRLEWQQSFCDNDLRSVPEELLHKLPPEILERRRLAQEEYVRWATEQGYKFDATKVIGYGIFLDAPISPQHAR
jgi:hypothetical protein